MKKDSIFTNIVLGNNIEYYDMSKKRNYFLPIGDDDSSSHFTESFDGQGFEIRDLYVETSENYPYSSMGMFAFVGEGGTVKNFGLFHPTIYNLTPASLVGVVCSINQGTISDVYVIANEYDHTDRTNKITTDYSNATAGIAAQNSGSGLIKDCYVALRFDTTQSQLQHPICPDNTATIENCYYDSELYQIGTEEGRRIVVSGADQQDEVNMKPLSNIDLKRVGISSNGMQNTNFHPLRADYYYNYIYASNNNQWNWQYPRLYGYDVSKDPTGNTFVISTPAQLINFPNTYEYYTYLNSRFELGSCIDMSEVAPYAYKPQVNYTIYSNRVTSSEATLYEYHADSNSDY